MTRVYDVEEVRSMWGSTDVYLNGVRLPRVVSVDFRNGTAEVGLTGEDGNPLIDRAGGGFVFATVRGDITMRPRKLCGVMSMPELERAAGCVDVFCNGLMVPNVAAVNFSDGFVYARDQFQGCDVANYVKSCGFVTVRPKDGE